MNYLCIDIGNTRVKYLIYKDNEPIKYLTTKNISQKKVDRLANEYNVAAIAVSSVRKNHLLKHFSWPKNIDIYILDHLTDIPINNKYNTPETLGNDRLAAVIGAHELYPNKNIAIIDMGTCITFDFIDKKGVYHGGNISPGTEMRFKAMNRYTSNLPIVEMKYHSSIIGKNTTMALQNGVIRGTIFEIESFIRSVKQDFGKILVILTGGNAVFFASYINNKIFVHQNLILRGLNKIIKYNENKKNTSNT